MYELYLLHFGYRFNRSSTKRHVRADAWIQIVKQSTVVAS